MPARHASKRNPVPQSSSRMVTLVHATRAQLAKVDGIPVRFFLRHVSVQDFLIDRWAAVTGYADSR